MINFWALRWSLVLAVAMSGLGCRKTDTYSQYIPLSGGEPPWLNIRVDTVRVSPQRPGTHLGWDPPASASSKEAECGLLGLVVGLINPVVGRGAHLLCRMDVQQKKGEGAQELPDLAVFVHAGMGKVYETHTEQDSISAIFRQEFLVPTAAIPPDGLVFEVIDRDGLQYEMIGRARALRRDLVATAFSSRHTMTLVDPQGGIHTLELIVEPYFYRYEPISDTMPANEGTKQIRFRPLRAGEVMEVQAYGQYRVGTWHDNVINPQGFPGNTLREYNFKTPPFIDAPHGSGLAIVAARDIRQGIVVTACTTVVTRLGGNLLIGINDEDPSNNQGWIQFAVGIRPATPFEWLGQEVAGCRK